VTGTPYFFQGKPLIRGGKPAMNERCCCVDECCCGPCIRFRFEVSGVTDGGTCAACADTNGTWITPPIFPSVIDGVCVYSMQTPFPSEVDFPRPLCLIEFGLLAIIECPIDGQIRLRAFADFDVREEEDDQLEPSAFELEQLFEGDCFTGPQELIRTATPVTVCDVSNATVKVSVIGCDDIQGRQVTGTSTLEGTLTAFANAEGDSEGASSLEGDLAAIGNRSGFVTARSKVQGRIDGDFEMAGTAKAASFVDGTLSAVGSRSGDVSGVSVVDGDATALAFFSKETIETSSTTGDLTSLVSASGEVSGVSLLDGSLVAFAAISGDVDGTSVTSGNATALGSLSGAAKASSKLTGRVEGDVGLIGGAQATSVLDGTLTSLVAAEGAATASSTLAASIASTASASGAITSTSTADGLLVAFYSVSGDVSGTSTVTGTLAALSSLEGSVSATSKLTGRLDSDVDISGSVTGTSTLTGKLVAFANSEGAATATSDTESDLSAIAFFSKESISTGFSEATVSAFVGAAGEVTATSTLTGELEACCCGDCIVFRYTISGLANGFCSTCDDYNTDNDSPPVYQSEDCVYSAQWESSDCNGEKLVFNAELICNDDGVIRLSGTIEDSSISPIPLEEPPEEGPEPVGPIRGGTDTFAIGTPCDELEITLTSDVGLQGVCDFDNATVVLKVVDCPENEAVIRKLTRKARKRKARRVRQPKVELPICQHRGEELGKADCQCAGKPMVWHCTLLDQPCIAQTVGKPITKAGSKRISSPVACSLCEHFEAK